ncbi:MAG: SemiSWEET family transporter [Odoribacter sp.]|nr:SemiSWEET family transporter [Odoribacter sp.]
MDLINIFGWLASICMILGYMPQAIVTIRTRDTDGIALPTFVMMGLGSLFFVIQGLLLHNWPLAVTNIITLICSVIIFSIKIYNDTHKKKS